MKFISKYKELKKVIIPSNYGYNNFGQRHYMPGKLAEFHDFEFTTDDKDSIEILKKDPRYGIDYWAADKDEKSPVTEEGKKLIDQEAEANEKVVTSCPSCGFRAVTNAGLKAHMRAKHK